MWTLEKPKTAEHGSYNLPSEYLWQEPATKLSFASPPFQFSCSQRRPTFEKLNKCLWMFIKRFAYIWIYLTKIIPFSSPFFVKWKTVFKVCVCVRKSPTWGKEDC